MATKSGNKFESHMKANEDFLGEKFFGFYYGFTNLMQNYTSILLSIYVFLRS